MLIHLEAKTRPPKIFYMSGFFSSGRAPFNALCSLNSHVILDASMKLFMFGKSITMTDESVYTLQTVFYGQF